MRYYLGVDWADQTNAIWVVDERGTKLVRVIPVFDGVTVALCDGREVAEVRSLK